VFGQIDCTPQEGMRFCEGAVETRVPSFDGVPLDVNVAFPEADATESPYPLIVRLHGYNGTKEGPYLGGARGASIYTHYTDEGFAVMTLTARGRAGSCGTKAARQAAPDACEKGWDHLGDARRSARDIQYLSGQLVDEGVVEPAIGLQGGSYGGGRSLLLATLHDRVQTPDGDYKPWTSPEHNVEMEVGAAVPFIAWSDLTNALAPNGRVLDYAIGPDTLSRNPLGAMKYSIVRGLWRQGQDHYNAPPGTDPSINLASWFKAFPTSGSLSDTSRQAAIEFTDYHSAIGVPMDRPPAPTLVANGFTDDIFPANEAVRWVNHVREEHPDAPVAQLYADFGHRRANQTSAELLVPRAMEWFKQHLQGREVEAPQGVEAFVQQCGGGFGERHHAETWRGLSNGEVRLVDSTESVVRSDAERRRISRQIDPPSGRSEKIQSGSCRTVPEVSTPGTASYAVSPTEEGFTLMGSPTVIARLTAEAEKNGVLVARLWDVAPEAGSRTLVTQTLVRLDPEILNTGQSAQQVFQLHANAYSFAPGHRAELQLLGRSTPYVRPPAHSYTVTVEHLDLRLPVAEAPDTTDGVQAPAPRVLPDGLEWAPGYGPDA
jgi:predicted acyl esterase